MTTAGFHVDLNWTIIATAVTIMFVNEKTTLELYNKAFY
jgi:hypothetical protein